MDGEAVLVDKWRSLLSCYNEVAVHLERELSERHGLTMSEFETLDRLVALDCDKRRMQALEAQMYLSQSALSRTVARLEKRGLVTRELCSDDRRGVIVCVTDAGVRLHGEARETRLTVLAERLTV
jgi:DNA-binding MarR family transcriptional regulator